eukprot:GHUV01036242.1.p1 GENE.GHUV01036242.1~~GHUV01036242.1.p1  ORF type:complete len:103 (+),score=9.55 GHUV01036242.1:611-919(+)
MPPGGLGCPAADARADMLPAHPVYRRSVKIHASNYVYSRVILELMYIELCRQQHLLDLCCICAGLCDLWATARTLGCGYCSFHLQDLADKRRQGCQDRCLYV